MSFGGQSKTEKANDATITANTAKLGGIADTASGRGDKTFKFFKQSAKPVMDFWKTILGGDRTEISQLLAPELSTISNTYSNAKKNLWMSPRGGGKVSSVEDLEAKQAEQTGNLFATARNTASNNLTNLSQIFGNLSLGEAGQGIGALGSSTQGLFGLNEEQQRIRDQRNQALGALGSGVGSAAGAYFGGK